ncbi:hypothetical protein HZC31_05800 [Candidatus Woesearchaeota archaeon]|nr:hypothetical protein [Candidatus Woesearchaeota archaeon]
MTNSYTIEIVDERAEEIERSLETRLHEITTDRVTTTAEVCTALEILSNLMSTLPRLYMRTLEEENTGGELYGEDIERAASYEEEIGEYYKRIIIEDDGNAANIQKYSERAKYLAIPKGALMQIQRVLGLAVNKMDREKGRENNFYQRIKEEAEREEIPFTETVLREFVQMDIGRRNEGDTIFLGLTDPGYVIIESFHYIVKKYCEEQSQTQPI